jgi:hypothetical protein
MRSGVQYPALLFVLRFREASMPEAQFPEAIFSGSWVNRCNHPVVPLFDLLLTWV